MAAAAVIDMKWFAIAIALAAAFVLLRGYLRSGDHDERDSALEARGRDGETDSDLSGGNGGD